MKNVFIWVAKLILAMLVIVVAVAMFVGAEYVVLFMIDNIGGYSYLDNYDTKKHIALWLLVFLVIQTVSKQMEDIKFSFKTKKSKLKNIKQYSNMNELEYLNNCKRTWNSGDANIEHCSYGLVTESAEIMDMLKKHKFYGRDFNMVNLKEEIGDLLYYVHILCDEIDYPIEQARKDNIIKLQKRYPEKFEDVIIRDVEKELSHI